MDFSIEKIQELIINDKIQWRGHILIRMQQRGIKIKEVIDCIRNGSLGS